MGAPNFELNPAPRAVKTYSLRIAILAILAVAILGGGPAWAEDDEYGSRAPFPAGPLRQIDDVLKPYGIRPSFTYSGDVLGNASGGIRRGVIYEGHIDFGIEADLEKLFGWSGAKLYGNVVNNHGDGLSREYIGNLMTVSSIEALNHTRLYELWIEQAVGKNVSLRFGQFGADAEFNNSKYASGFLNSTFGWPALSSITLPAGGPAFPLTALGVRAKATLSDQLTLLFAMFDGNAAGPGADDPQNLDPHGVNFRLRDLPLLMAEMQYRYRLDASRPGTLKLGGWLHTGNFSDPRFDTNGLSLADPASNGMPLQHRGAAAPYAVLEQMLVPFDAKGATGIAAFGRLQATQSDRSAVDFYADCGVNVSGFVGAAKRRDLRRFRLRWDIVGRAWFRPGRAAFWRADDRSQLRGGVGGNLFGADRPRLDRAAGFSIHHASWRRRDRSEFAQRAADTERACPRYAHDRAMGRTRPQFLAIGRAAKQRLKSDPPGRGHAGRVFNDRRVGGRGSADRSL